MVRDMETITIDKIADYISKYVVIGTDGKPYYGYVKFQIEEGRIGIYRTEQTKKIERG